MKAAWVAEEFQLDLAFNPGATYAESWKRIDPWFQLPWQDIAAGWGMVAKAAEPGSGVRYRLA